MEHYLTLIFDTITNEISWSIILLVIAIGEIVKKYWKSKKIVSFFKVLIPTLPITVLYSYLAVISSDKTLLSYLVAFWLFPLIVKPLLVLIGLSKPKNSSSKTGGELPNTDDEQAVVSKSSISGELPNTDDEEGRD